MSHDDRIMNMLTKSSADNPLGTRTLARGSTIEMTLRSLERLQRAGKVVHCKAVRDGVATDQWWRAGGNDKG